MTMLGISTSEKNEIHNVSAQFNNSGTIQSRIESSGDAIFSSTAEADDDMTTNITTDQLTDMINVSDQGSFLIASHWTKSLRIISLSIGFYDKFRNI